MSLVTSTTTAFVTGGASGIGEAAVRQLLLLHHVLGVTIADQDADTGRRLAESLNQEWRQQQEQHGSARPAVLFVQLDVTDNGAFSKALETHWQYFGEYPRISLLNAGVGDRTPLVPLHPSSSLSEPSPSSPGFESSFQRVVDVNFNAVMEGIQQLVPRLLLQQQKKRSSSKPNDKDNQQTQREVGAGFICITASTAGIYPGLKGQEVYSATKAACVHLARCFSYLDSADFSNIRVVAICPSYTDTNLLRRGLQIRTLPPLEEMIQDVGGKALLQPGDVASGMMDMAFHQTKYYKGGSVMVVFGPNKRILWKFRGDDTSAATGSGSSDQPLDPATPVPLNHPALKIWATQEIMKQKELQQHNKEEFLFTYRAVEIVELGTQFDRVSRIVTKTLPLTAVSSKYQLCSSSRLKPGTVLIRTLYAGINASDVNYSAGRYHTSKEQAQKALPLAAGFESVGVVVAVSTSADSNNRSIGLLRLGDAVAVLSYGGFSEYQIIPAQFCLPIIASTTPPATLQLPKPEHVTLLTSGLTASIALERPLQELKQRKSKSKPTVLVTAAAGGTGQFVIQLAKLANCRVVAVAGGKEKCDLCQSLGADSVVDYKALRQQSTQNDDLGYIKLLTQTLKRACGPGGADLIYESVGGDMFHACERALGFGGKLLIIGMMSQYTSGTNDSWNPSTTRPGLQDRLLAKGASIEGFFLLQHTKSYRRHFAKLSQLFEEGKLNISIDSFLNNSGCCGLEATNDAVARLQSGQSSGKVVLQVARDLPSAAGAAAAPSTRSRL